MKAGKLIKKMNLSGNCIIAIKEGTDIATDQAINEMIEEAKKLYKDFSILFVVVENLDDIGLIDEEVMASYGWFKVESLRGMLGRKEETDD